MGSPPGTVEGGSPEPAAVKDKEQEGRIPLCRAHGATSLRSKWGQAALCYVSFLNIFFYIKNTLQGSKDFRGILQKQADIESQPSFN